MRERKWRAIETKTGQLIYSDQVGRTAFWDMWFQGEFDLETVGDFVGLLDKNSVEIYEGDIVEKWCHCSLLERLNPLYNKGVGYYKSLTTTVKWSEQGLNYNIYPHHDDAYWEVIGNIYENKDLL